MCAVRTCVLVCACTLACARVRVCMCLSTFVTVRVRACVRACVRVCSPNDFACGYGYMALYDLAPAAYKLALSSTMTTAVASYKPYDWFWVRGHRLAAAPWFSQGERACGAR